MNKTGNSKSVFTNPANPEFVTEIQSSMKAPTATIFPKTQLANVSEAESHGLVPKIGSTFAG